MRGRGSGGGGALKGGDVKNAIHINPVDTRTMRILAYGTVRTISELEVNGWKYQGKEIDMKTRYTL